MNKEKLLSKTRIEQAFKMFDQVLKFIIKEKKNCKKKRMEMDLFPKMNLRTSWEALNWMRVNGKSSSRNATRMGMEW